jgi:hypothetical protein
LDEVGDRLHGLPVALTQEEEAEINKLRFLPIDVIDRV